MPALRPAQRGAALLTAFILARDHQLPLHVFDIDTPGAATTICRGEQVGTLVS